MSSLFERGLRAIGAAALLLAASCGTGAAMAQTRLAVAGDYAFPPYSFVQGDKPAGIDVEILQELGRRSGVAFDIRLTPFKRVIESVREGTVDAGMAVLRSGEREGFAIFTGVLHSSSYVLFVPRGSPLSFDGLDSLRGKRIGKVRGFLISEAFDAEAAAGRILVSETASAEQGLRMLLAGRLDALSGQSVVMRYLAREAGWADSLQMLAQPLAPDRPAYLVLSRASALPDKDRLAQRLRLALEAMHKDGTIERIEARFLR